MTIWERLNQLPAEVLQIRLGSWNDITMLLCFYSCFSWPRAEGTVLWNRFTQGKLHLIWARLGSNVIPFWFNIEEMSQRDMLLVFWDLYLSIIFERLIQEKNPTQYLGGGEHGLRVIAIKIKEALREMTGHSMLFFFPFRNPPNKSYLIHIPLGYPVVPIFKNLCIHLCFPAKT